MTARDDMSGSGAVFAVLMVVVGIGVSRLDACL